MGCNVGSVLGFVLALYGWPVSLTHTEFFFLIECHFPILGTFTWAKQEDGKSNPALKTFLPGSNNLVTSSPFIDQSESYGHSWLKEEESNWVPTHVSDSLFPPCIVASYWDRCHFICRHHSLMIPSVHLQGISLMVLLLDPFHLLDMSDRHLKFNIPH